MRATQTVGVLSYVGTTEDAYGNETPTWASPVPTPVYGWAPAATNEVNASRHAVTADLELYAPSGFAVDSRDRVQIQGRTYEVQGDVEDFGHGPFGFQPGVRVNLRRFG